MYELDRDELTMEEFVDKIKTDESLRVWGELETVYGNNGEGLVRHGSVLTYVVGQIKNVKLIEENADSRRLMVNSWNPGVR